MIEIFQNIREIYDFRKPVEDLAHFVEFFSESSPSGFDQYFAKGHSQSGMFASWTPTFYINLGTPYQIELDKVFHHIGATDDILILRNGQVTRHILPTDRIFTVKFYPGGLEAVLGISQTRLDHKVIPLGQVLPPSLLMKMKQPITFTERVLIIQEYLLLQRAKRTKKDHYLKIVNDAIGEYHTTGMQLNTSQVAERLFLTSKSINRYFSKVIGLPPKAYFSILRTRAALAAFIQARETFDPWDYGYYDLSHFSKDVVKLTGQRLSNAL
jgi:AraC-like DNA-binding protein